MRDIQDILYFRGDISPFLVHLTRDKGKNMDAAEALTRIITEKKLVAGQKGISDARFAIKTITMSKEEQTKYFGAISFTETPLDEIHCLLDIKYRTINLRPYGLVLLKDRAVERGIEPVFYVNNKQGDKNSVVQALRSLIKTKPDAAARILPLIAVFGKKIQPPDAAKLVTGDMDFKWEREWRYPAINGPYELRPDEVFIGLCPHEEMEKFEGIASQAGFSDFNFIDPTRNIKSYATKLIQARQRLDIKYSVV